MKQLLGFCLLCIAFAPAQAQHLFDIDSTYQGVLNKVFANPDMKIQFEQTNVKVVASYFNWYASYYFSQGKLYQSEISTTFPDMKSAEVEYQKYTQYAQSVLGGKIGKEIAARKKHQVSYVTPNATLNIRIETIRSKTVFVACLTYCKIAPTTAIEPDDCISMP